MENPLYYLQEKCQKLQQVNHMHTVLVILLDIFFLVLKV